MTTTQIEAITMGKAEAWHHDHLPTEHSDENAIGYRIIGLQPPFSAIVAGFRKWDFFVFKNNREFHRSKESYDSKEEAFASLKDWLRNAALC